MPIPSLQPPLKQLSRLAVVGLGLAGCSLLRALAQAKARFQVVGFESTTEEDWTCARGAVGVLHPFVSKDHNLASQISQSSLACSLQWLEALQAPAQGFAGLQGVLEKGERQPGGWADLTWFRQACLSDARSRLGDRLSLRFSEKVSDLGDLLSNGFDAVVITTGHSQLLPESLHLALTPIAGQVSYLDLQTIDSDLARQRLQSLLPECVVCDEATLTPWVKGRVYVGASFHRGMDQALLRHDDQRDNLARLAAFRPELANALEPHWSKAGAWTGVRYATRDRLLHLGLPVSPDPYLSRSVSRLEQLPRWHSVYCFLGLGSRGLSTAPWAAECLVRALLGQPQDFPERLFHAIDPGRFLLRDHVRA